MPDVADVAIIGYGPVGMALAALLGRAGHRVVVAERYSGKYNLPRAAIFDDETMRTFAKLGIAERMLPKVHAQRRYEWRNAAGDLLIEHDFAAVGKSGWAEWYMMYQPDLEDALDDVCREIAGVAVKFGAPVTGIDQDGAGVTLTTGSGETIRARYAVGCDGGNSFVREALAVPMQDYGFSEPWMVCDFRLTAPHDVPMARQVCDPAQPISIISLGPDHHRFSFMLKPSDDPEVERQPDRVWTRVGAYLTRHQAELIRVATYTFRSLVAERWRVGRILLAGDAAHQMPPFLGQGMCSGVRDALNLSLKFDMLLGGQAGEEVLDTYQSERDPHVRAVIIKGIELGRVQTMRDPETARARDAELLAQRRSHAKPEKIVFPPLGPGLFGPGSGAGSLFVQGVVEAAGRRERFDALLGYGSFLLANERGMAALDAESRTALATASVRLVGLSRNSDMHIRDVDGVYAAWFEKHACDLVAVRSDFHVWGSAEAGTGAQLAIEFAACMGGDLLSSSSRIRNPAAERGLPVPVAEEP